MKTELIKIRVTASEKDAFLLAADLAGLALSAWARERLRKAAARELEDVNQQIPFRRGP